MRATLAHYFTNSVAAVLAAFGTALFLNNIAQASLTQPQESLFTVSLSTLFWILGALAWAVTLMVVFVPSSRGKLALILWFSANIIIYRLNLEWRGVHDPTGYLGSLAHTFDLTPGSTCWLLNLLFLYLFLGSAVFLFGDFMTGAEEAYRKAVCIHCGGHIAFPAQNVGQTVHCPHCRQETRLPQVDFLKMACFFCQKHIEFPPHALGQKIPCPHCKMDITLKEPP